MPEEICTNHLPFFPEIVEQAAFCKPKGLPYIECENFFEMDRYYKKYL
ncbi:MAG: hypothetical protein ABIL74_07335 [candidate division WOR-3 bacterium]